jgi:hypothetical protein
MVNKGEKMPRQTDKKAIINDDVYLKIWDIEQKHTSTRWTLMTFYLSISFAIFGLSLQNKDLGIPIFVPQGVAIVIYWFAYLLFRRFNEFNEYLRRKLMQLEENGQTTVNLQIEFKHFLKQKKRLSATQLLLVFGFLYTLAGIAISLYVQK